MVFSLTSTDAPASFVQVSNSANLVISGTWVATIGIQYLTESGTWIDMGPTFTANTVSTINLGAPAMVRPKASAYTSGTATIEIRP